MSHAQQKTQSKSMRLTAMIVICKYFIKPRCIVQCVVCCWLLSEKLRLSYNLMLGGTLNPESPA